MSEEFVKLSERQWVDRIAWLLMSHDVAGADTGHVYMGHEFRLWDRSRADIVTDRLSIEVDWAYKWSEAVGQCLWYSLNMGQSPGIILLLNDFERDRHHVYRCLSTCTACGIEQLWLVDTKSGTLDIHGQSYSLPKSIPEHALQAYIARGYSPEALTQGITGFSAEESTPAVDTPPAAEEAPSAE